MYKKVDLKYFLPALLIVFLSLLLFYASPFSDKAFLIGVSTSLYVIVLSLFMNDRLITQLSKSIPFLALKLVYSFSFLTFFVTLIALMADRLIFLLKFIGVGYSTKISFIILLTVFLVGYSCLAFLVRFVCTKNPSGVSCKTFLKENKYKISGVFITLLGLFLLVVYILSPYILAVLPKAFYGQMAFALVVVIVLISTDFSKIKYNQCDEIPSKPQSNKLFLIGIDAADWKVLNPLLRKNKLPNIKNILDKAAYGYLDCYGERLSPVLWTSFITGATSDVHGVRGFVFHEKGKKNAISYKSYHRKVPALWNILSAAGKKVGILNWMLSYPAEKVNGYMVSRLSAEDYRGITYPDQLKYELSCLLDTPESSHTNSIEEEDIKKASEELKSLERITTYLLDKYPTDTWIFYTQTTDTVMHRFWKYREPQKFKAKEWDLSPLKIEKYKNAIDDHWCQFDNFLGKILEKADENTNIVIVSDHGAKARAKPFFYVNGNRLLEKLGLLSFQKVSGKIDFSKTKVYLNDPTSWSTSCTFSLNVKGREEKGVIEKEAYEEERERIMGILQKLRTSKGKKVFESVCRVNGGGTDITAEHSSLLRTLNDEALIVDKKEIPLKSLLKRVERNSGNHDPHGIVILSGPAFRNKIISGYMIEYAASFVLSYLQGLLEKKIIHFLFELLKRVKFINPYTTLDLMPTLLHLLRHPSAEYMQGNIMTKALKSRFKKMLNFCRVKKYHISIFHKDINKIVEKEEEKIRDQLRGLGYLG